MTTLLRCANGHEWPAPPGESALSGSTTSACPVCGAPDRTLHWPATLPGDLPPAPPPGGQHPLGPDAPPAVPGYEVLNELGRGGMGVVYLAREAARGRLVALKVIRKERLGHPDMVSRFRREAQAAARLAHPNVVTVHQADREGDVHYLSMEYVPGVTLQRLVDEHGPLPVAQACDFVRQVALGLQHAADQRLVHRDIKPANLMVLAPPAGPVPPRALVKILDMGVARIYQLAQFPEESLTTLTREGSVIGTPDYIAPEQLEDPHGADVRADLYSLGCTFYFLLTGRVPFPGGTLFTKLDSHRRVHPPSVDQLRAEVPAAVAAVVRRLMAKHPDDRYRQPADLAAALEQLARTGQLPASHQPTAVREARALAGHAGAVPAVAFTPDGRGLLSGGADRTLRLWDVVSGAEMRRLGDLRHEVACLAVSATGLVLVGQGVSVRVLELASGKEQQRLAGHIDAVRALAVTPDGRYAVTGSEDRTVRLWDLPSGREVECLLRHKAGVTGVAVSADGDVVLSAGRDQALRLWSTAAYEPRAFAVPRGPVLAVALAADGRTALSGHFDTTARLWDVDTGRELRRLSGHRQMVGAVAFTAGGLAVTAGHDRTGRGWDPASGAEEWLLQGHAGAILSVAAAPDGRRVATAGAGGEVRLWEVPG